MQGLLKHIIVTSLGSKYVTGTACKAQHGSVTFQMAGMASVLHQRVLQAGSHRRDCCSPIQGLEKPAAQGWQQFWRQMPSLSFRLEIVMKKAVQSPFPSTSLFLLHCECILEKGVEFWLHNRSWISKDFYERVGNFHTKQGMPLNTKLKSICLVVESHHGAQEMLAMGLFFGCMYS